MRRGRGVSAMVRSCSRAVLVVSLLAAVPAAAQDVTGREERLVDIHALLLDMPAIDAPGSLAPGQLDLGLEVTGIPVISGDVGAADKRELTASDHARLYPRPRLALGLPAPPGFRAFAGAAYIPPIEIASMTVNSLGLEAGMAWVGGPLHVGLRLHGVLAHALSPVSSPSVRDRLNVVDGGWDLRAGYELRYGKLALTPYAGVGQVWTKGDFRSSVDGGTVHSTHSVAALEVGGRALFRDHWEAALEYSAYPGRLWNPRVRVGYILNLGW